MLTAPPSAATSAPRKRGLAASIKRRLAERAAFTSTYQWLKFVVASSLASNCSTGPAVQLRLASETLPITIRLFTTDARVVKEVLIYREYDALSPLLQTLPPKPSAQRIVVDLGSNIGCTLRAWQQLWPGCTIIAAEPDANNHALCVANLNAANARVERVCIADTPGTVTLDTTAGAWGVTMRRDNANTPPTAQRVQAITIDDLLTRAQCHAEIDLLKCDIEGAEAAIFANPGPWLARTHLIALEIHPPYSITQLQAHIAAATQNTPTTFTILGQEKRGGNALLFLKSTARP